ncbi:hypothetical protein LJC54_02385 [Parabacteroides sp. OttesenSCG-928-J18]|nr:hypothetical protein [Bacteroidales bacterium OttesenSCG-928-L03]MDL2244335.1 hypothetical protein [Parabacteroides sp. OttesenSCG-928-J18]MDL2255232.1 hypothetical protein [Parabacteroides sp. OttesenSCG-928-K15]
MKTILNDSILEELRKVTEKDTLCKSELWSINVNLKQKISEVVNNEVEMLGNYRYCIHLQNELIYKKKVDLKKKERPANGAGRFRKFL